MQVERRAARSAHPIEATTLYLKAVAARRAHRALALADADGLLLAGASDGIDIEAMAAVAPHAAGGHAAAEGLLGLVTRGRALQVWPLRVDEQPFYLAAVDGERGLPEDVVADLARILM